MNPGNLLIDQEYLKNIPKTGRDHYQTKQSHPPPLHPTSNQKYNSHQHAHHQNAYFNQS